MRLEGPHGVRQARVEEVQPCRQHLGVAARITGRDHGITGADIADAAGEVRRLMIPRCCRASASLVDAPLTAMNDSSYNGVVGFLPGCRTGPV